MKPSNTLLISGATSLVLAYLAYNGEHTAGTIMLNAFGMAAFLLSPIAEVLEKIVDRLPIQTHVHHHHAIIQGDSIPNVAPSEEFMKRQPHQPPMYQGKEEGEE